VFELDSRARKHIKKELKIYNHLSSRQSSSKHFAQMLAHGSFMITSKGLCLSYVSGEVIMFSEMTAQQKSACELALEELHSCGVKHGDVHYGIFLLNENFASIIDFGLSSICSDEDLLEREKDLLEWKLDNDDNSGKQEITKNY
jgi:tRNA A-37 threonylcarbamoyl transferase component Bud32